MTSDRTTLNIATDEHRATRDVKDEYGESWTDVLRFYREHRGGVSVSDNRAVDTDALVTDLVAQLPKAVADEVVEQLR
jgi:hypothetical protein